MPSPKILQANQDGVLTLTLNRPDKLNAIDNELASELLEALDVAETDPGVRVLRLGGNGRAFCAGRDISAQPTDKDLTLVQSIAKAIVGSSKPVVAAVHGWTVGAGLEIMLCADVVLADTGTRFKLPEASLGVFVTGGLTATLPATVGLARAKSLALLGEEFSASEALAWGMLYKITLDQALDVESWRVAIALATLSHAVASQFKRVFNLMGMSGFEQAIEEENKTHRRWRS